MLNVVCGRRLLWKLLVNNLSPTEQLVSMSDARSIRPRPEIMIHNQRNVGRVNILTPLALSCKYRSGHMVTPGC